MRQTYVFLGTVTGHSADDDSVVLRHPGGYVGATAARVWACAECGTVVAGSMGRHLHDRHHDLLEWFRDGRFAPVAYPPPEGASFRDPVMKDNG